MIRPVMVGRPKFADTRKIVSLPAGLAQAIEDYRFTNRLKTEAEAIRRLIEAGLNATAATAVTSPGRSPRQSGKTSHTDQDAENGDLKPAPDQADKNVVSKPRRPRAKPLLMSKEAQIRALRERDA
jgi:hypothetical protein